MRTDPSSLDDARLPKYCSNMVKSMSNSHWTGIGLTILCLGIVGGCCCADKVDKPPLPSALCIDRLPPCPTVVGACAGYHPTCWMSWPDCCPTCPPPDQVVPVPRGPAEDTPRGEGVRSPDKGLEAVPMPQEEPQPKVAEPPKAEEPPSAVELPRAKTLPKTNEPPSGRKPHNAKEPPKAKNPLPKVEKPLSIVPNPPSIGDPLPNESDTSAWEEAPLPEQYVKSPVPNKASIGVSSMSGCVLHILDSDSEVEESAPATDASLTILAPKKRDALPEVRQVVFRQQEEGRGYGRRDCQQDK